MFFAFLAKRCDLGWPRLQGLPRVQQERGLALAQERGQERVQAHETWVGERARRSCSRLTSGLVFTQPDIQVLA